MAVRYGLLSPGVLTETVAASIPVLATTFRTPSSRSVTGADCLCRIGTRPRWRPRSERSPRPHAESGNCDGTAHGNIGSIDQHDVSYCETTLLRSYAQALHHLHHVGQPLRAKSAS